MYTPHNYYDVKINIHSVKRKMDAVRLFEIHYGEPGSKDGFYEGQEVYGEIRLELREDTVIDYLDIEFTGTASVEVVNGETASRRKKAKPDPTDISITCDESYLNQKITLYSRDNNALKTFLVPAGSHTYTFRVQLPYNLPSSIEADHGSIKYYATSTLTRPWYPEETISKGFIIRSLVDLNRIPQAVRPVTSEGQEAQLLFCCVVGYIQTNWYLERTAYIPGDSIQIIGQIHNRSRIKIRKSKAKLIKHVRYFDPSDSRYHRERHSIASMEKGAVLAGASSFWREEMKVPAPLPPSGLKGCTLMDVRYSLKITVVPAGPVNSLESSTDIIIGSVAKGQSVGDGMHATQQAQQEASLETEDPEYNYFV